MRSHSKALITLILPALVYIGLGIFSKLRKKLRISSPSVGHIETLFQRQLLTILIAAVVLDPYFGSDIIMIFSQ